jgi:hypothetical protein
MDSWGLAAGLFLLLLLVSAFDVLTAKNSQDKYAFIFACVGYGTLFIVMLGNWLT